MAKNHLVDTLPEGFAEALTAKLLASKKYRALEIPPATVHDLIFQAQGTAADPKTVEQIVREKLHNLAATYLGDPDYETAAAALDAAYADGDDGQVRQACLDILACHASTKERIPLLEEFYPRLFALTGVPLSIMDLACGLNPFALSWMNLPAGTRYYAYDLHRPRLELINHFFALNRMELLAIQQDILVQPPDIECDVAIFFKEAHRFEQRQRDCNREFWKSLRCKYLLVSLPTASLTGKHPKTDQHRRLVMETVADLPWQVTEIEFSNEIVFCIEKDA